MKQRLIADTYPQKKENHFSFISYIVDGFFFQMFL